MAKGESWASSAATRSSMLGNRSKDTKPELALRRELHRRGLRYFVHRRPVTGIRRTADLVFPRRRVAVFVDGCFWHGCPEHGTSPRANSEWWKAKITANRTRDRDTDRMLAELGWTVVRIWEHEPAPAAAARVLALIAPPEPTGPARPSRSCTGDG